MITERTVRQWRVDALKSNVEEVRARLQFVGANEGEVLNTTVLQINELNRRILRLTGELLDYFLMRKETSCRSLKSRNATVSNA